MMKDEKDMDEMNMYDEDEGMDDMEGEEASMDEEIDLEEILNELELEEGEEAEEEEDLEEVHRVGQPNYKADGVSDVLNRATDVNDNLAENEKFDLDSLLKEINDLEEDEEILEVEDDEKEEVKERKIVYPRNRNKMKFRENKGCGCSAEKSKIGTLQTQLKESKQAYKTVRTELNEVNLLNSKLL